MALGRSSRVVSWAASACVNVEPPHTRTVPSASAIFRGAGVRLPSSSSASPSSSTLPRRLPPCPVLGSRPSSMNVLRSFFAQGGPPVKEVNVGEANELLTSGEYKYLDVRTPEEFAAGHPPGAVNIPIMLSASFGMTRVPDFVQQVQAHFPTDTPLLLGCKMGGRSMQAALDLQNAGFTDVFNVAGGYLAWAGSGLPTTKP